MGSRHAVLRTVLAGAVAAFAGCGGGGTDGANAPGAATGAAALFLKDAPVATSDGRTADAINVEILRITMHAGHGDHPTVFEAAPGSGIAVNILALDIPLLLTSVSVPTGSYHEIEIRLNPANATIHFTDNDTIVPLVVTQEGDDDGELEFEFEPALVVESSGVSNAVLDFAPVVTLDGSHYVLGHDHEADDTGEVEEIDDDGDDDDGDDDEGEHHGAEIEGGLVEVNGDLLTLDVHHHSQIQVDISDATEFEVDGDSVSKSAFLAALAAGDHIEAEGTFIDGVLRATQARKLASDDDD